MTDLSEVRLMRTAPHDCGYLSDRKATMLFTEFEDCRDPAIYNDLASLGFRRSGNHLYFPYCQDCNACIPMRIRVADFKFKRRHRRILRQNKSLIVQEKEPRITLELLQLYKKYIAQRHKQGKMYPGTARQFNDFLLSAWSNTHFLEFRLSNEEGEAGELVAVAVTDYTAESLLAIYTFFDPDKSFLSLGSLAILHQIEKAKRDGFEYLYLGYWIDSCTKMNYKADYRPHQLLIKNRWVDIA